MTETLPATAGVGFKPQHFDSILSDEQPPGFIEVHAENYMGAGGRPHAQLAALCQRFALSLHGVGLSLAGEERPDKAHLGRLVRLIERYRPHSVSEHLAWSSHGGMFFDDLLPVPYTEATLGRLADHVMEAQDALGVRILMENPATYLRFQESTIEEVEFLGRLVARADCRLLLDINNVFVSTKNHGGNAYAYLAEFPFEAVEEIHLAGHDVDWDGAGETLLIDSHGSPIADPVWALFAAVVGRHGPRPTLVERDNDVPAWSDLRREVADVRSVLAATSLPRVA